MIDLRKIDLNKLNSMTKYPSIPTYHTLNPKDGCLEEPAIEFPCGTVYATEKLDGTNSRVVLMPDGKFLIGSRKEFLCCGDDVIYNQSLGIVDIMRDTAEKITRKIDLPDCISVFFFESYGKGINSKAYSTKSTSHRMFDVATITEKQFNEMMEWPIGNISAWRENGGQNFYSIDRQKCIAESLSIERVPDLLEVSVDFMPKTLTNALKFLEDNIPSTQAAIDDSGKGDPEGIVFRSSDRRVIAKARYEDYKRTFKKQKQGK